MTPLMRSGKKSEGEIEQALKTVISTQPDLLWVQYHRTQASTKAIRASSVQDRLNKIVQQQFANHSANTQCKIIIEGPFGVVDWSVLEFLWTNDQRLYVGAGWVC